MIRYLFLLSLVVTACLGGLARGFGDIYAYRLLAVVALAWLVSRHVSGPGSAMARSLGAFAAMLTVVGLGFILIDPRSTETLERLSVLETAVTGLLLTAVTVRGARDHPWIPRGLAGGWVVVYASVCLHAVWEDASGVHAPNYLSTHDRELLSRIDAPASVFGNPNALALFVALTIPLVLAVPSILGVRWLRILAWPLVAAGAYVVMLTESQLGLAAIAIQIAVFLALSPRTRTARVAAAGFLVVAVAGVVATYSGRFLSSLQFGGAAGAQSSVSETIRLSLLKNGWWAITETGGLGAGPAGFQRLLRYEGAPESTNGVVDPHNGLIELVVSYGLVPGAILVAAAFVLVRTQWRRLSVLAGAERAGPIAVLQWFAGIGISMAANSTLLTLPYFWLNLATVLAIGEYRGSRAEAPDAIAGSRVHQPKRVTPTVR